MPIELDLSRHCIETEMRRCYNRALSRYFGTPADRGRLEEEIELLTEALESFDFPALRSRHATLAGGRPGRRAHLRRAADGRPRLDFDPGAGATGTVRA